MYNSLQIASSSKDLCPPRLRKRCIQIDVSLLEMIEDPLPNLLENYIMADVTKSSLH